MQHVHPFRVQFDEGEQQEGEGHERGAPVAEEGQGNANDRGQPDGHAYVDGKVEEQDGHYAIAVGPGELRALPVGYEYNPEHQHKKEDNHYEAAEETPFLTDGTEDEVSGLLRHELELGLSALQKALARKTT